MSSRVGSVVEKPVTVRASASRTGRSLVLWLIVIAATILYAAHDWYRYTGFRSAGYDLGIFDQAVRHYAHFDAPLSSIKGPNYNLLGDHWHPIIALLAPLYWIWADPRMLGFALAVLIASSALPVHDFTQRRFGTAAGLLATAGYLVWWPIQSLVDFDFHEIAFGLPLIAFLINALDTGRYRTILVLCGLLLLVREDMGMELVMVAIILAFRGRRGMAAALAVIGAGGYYLVTAMLIPAFAASGGWVYWTYPALGPNALSAVGHVGTHPLQSAALLVDNPAKRRLVGLLFGPLAGLPLGSPYLLLALPILFERLWSDRPSLWNTAFHYDAFLAPVLVLAAIDTLHRILGTHDRSKMIGTGMLAAFATLSVVPTVLGGPTIKGQLYPLHSTLTGADARESRHISAQRALVAAIPPGTCLDSYDTLIPHLVAHDVVSSAIHDGPAQNWLALDLTLGDTNGPGSPTAKQLEVSKIAAGFRVVFHQDNVVLLHRDGPEPAHCGDVN